MTRSAKQQTGSRNSAPQPQKGGGDKGKKAPEPGKYFTLNQADVLDAVKSLYADRLEPFGRILLRRVRERCSAKAGTTEAEAPLVDPKSLHQVCWASRALMVRHVDGNEISVLLRDAPKDFVDVCSLEDHYPEEMWEEAGRYFDSLQGQPALLPGGRYACAQALVTRNLPFVAGLSLGEVCHIVQLAVSKRKLLGYVDGNMVPYAMSEENVKEQCAAWQQPFSHSKVEVALPVATWDQVRTCLSLILQSAASPEPGAVSMSNVKRIFRTRFSLDLSETALGHARLSDVLVDPRLQDICHVEARPNGQFLCWSCPATLEDAPKRAPQHFAGPAAGRSPQDSHAATLPPSWAPGPSPVMATRPVRRPTPEDLQCLSTVPFAAMRSPAGGAAAAAAPEPTAFSGSPHFACPPPLPESLSPHHGPDVEDGELTLAPAVVARGGRQAARTLSVSWQEAPAIPGPPGLTLERSEFSFFSSPLTAPQTAAHAPAQDSSAASAGNLAACLQTLLSLGEEDRRKTLQYLSSGSSPEGSPEGDSVRKGSHSSLARSTSASSIGGDASEHASLCSRLPSPTADEMAPAMLQLSYPQGEDFPTFLTSRMQYKASLVAEPTGQDSMTSSADQPLRILW